MIRRLLDRVEDSCLTREGLANYLNTYLRLFDSFVIPEMVSHPIATYRTARDLRVAELLEETSP